MQRLNEQEEELESVFEIEGKAGLPQYRLCDPELKVMIILPMHLCSLELHKQPKESLSIVQL